MSYESSVLCSMWYALLLLSVSAILLMLFHDPNNYTSGDNQSCQGTIFFLFFLYICIYVFFAHTSFHPLQILFIIPLWPTHCWCLLPEYLVIEYPVLEYPVTEYQVKECLVLEYSVLVNLVLEYLIFEIPVFWISSFGIQSSRMSSFNISSFGIQSARISSFRISTLKYQ